MRNKFLLASLFMLLPLMTFAGPIFVKGGAGQSEYSIIFARENLPRLFSMCDEGRCQLNANECVSLLQLQQASLQPPKALFKKSQEMGTQLYLLQKQSGEVWFNLDLLWRNAEKNVAYDIPAAAALWADVLGNDKPQIRAELERVLRTKFHRSLFDINAKNALEAMVWELTDANERLYVRDADMNSHDLTDSFVELAQCEVPVTQLKFYSLRWVRGIPVPRLEVMASWRCGGSAHRARASMSIHGKWNKSELYTFEAKDILLGLEGE